jgi:D-alanyl-lipoteichoic acid acyltransferase DltB (MBOAT superfamily)
LILLIFSTFLDYFTGLKIFEAVDKKWRLIWLWISIVINLGFLAIFKYYNFFITSFADGLSFIGFKPNFTILEIVLPVGISFYTFHGLSYVIDLYNNKFKPEKDFINYSVFVSFFPLLVAGPIERASHLLPQITRKREFNYSQTIDGLRQILWGLLKKIVIADNCAEYANKIFNHYNDYSGITLFIGALFFTVQIYCDFSGYSDIALGTARLFGIELIRNFAFPYFSRDIAEFWRRWNMSLSSWFRDYLYIPLGGSKGGIWIKIRNTFIIFLVSGLWHGANWTFLAWGFLNALFIMPSIIFKTNRNNLEIVAKGKYFPTFKEFISILVTFLSTVFAWIFFRSASISDALDYIKRIFSTSFFSIPNDIIINQSIYPLIICFFLIEWIGREQQYAIATIGKNWYTPLRWTFYYVIIFILFFFIGKEQQFIYFQF